MRRSRSRRIPPERGLALRRALGWALAALGAICLVLTGAGFALDARPLVVRTGSMAPSLPIGTVALVEPVPASSVSVGDVVAVVRADGRRILHRVRKMRPAGDGWMTLVLRGDGNRADDPPVTVARVERPLIAVPALGRPVTWLGGRWAQFWLGVLAGALAIVWVARMRHGREPT